MKIMLPADGRINSTALLYHALTATEHDIVAIHFVNSSTPGDKDTLNNRDLIFRTGFDLTNAWLMENAREFETQYSSINNTDVNGMAFDDEELVPIRNGFTVQKFIYQQKCLYSNYGRQAALIEPNVVWLPETLWDQVFDTGYNNRLLNVYKGHTAIPLIKPFATTLPRGIVFNYKNTPLDLAAVSARCETNLDQNIPCGTCYSCVVNYFYNTFCLGWNDTQLAAIEDHINSIIKVGKYFTEARAETYFSGELYKSLNDISYWSDYLAQYKLIGLGD